MKCNIVEFNEAQQILEEAKKKSPPKLPEIVSGKQIRQIVLPLPPEMIGGLLSQGEKGELAGGSKSFKTWALIHQALCVASGADWWGFKSFRNNVIFLNLEIPQPFFEQRVRVVASALGIHVPDNFFCWHLRKAKLGEGFRWGTFLAELKTKCGAIPNPFLTSDPIYKLLGGRNENSAGDVAQLLEQLDDMVEIAQGANFFGHHFAKGNASAKEIIDRASGSGVFQRDPDSILTMTPHQNEGSFTIDLILRNHPPSKPFVVKWQHPLFVREDKLDPKELKKPKSQFQQEYKLEIFASRLGHKELSTSQFRKLMDEEEGMSKTTFYRMIKEAEAHGIISYDKVAEVWETVSRFPR